MSVNEYRLSFWSDENVPKLDSDPCTTLNILKRLNCTCQKGESKKKKVEFYYMGIISQ